MNNLTLLKIGGNILDNPKLLSAMLDNFAAIEGYKILIHGGGKIANVLMKQMGLEPKMVDGRRITDEKTLEIVTMVYGGLINKNLVCALQERGCNAIGLTGADANIIPALKRPVKDINYGFVGDIDTSKINTGALEKILTFGMVPVLAPLTHDGKGSMLNTNADTIASSVAVLLAKLFRVKLVYCFEKRGVLSDINNDDSVITEIDEEIYNRYKSQGAIHSGMIPKLDNAFNALKSGVSQIIICGPEAFKNQNPETGTTIHL
jgi:acetylglutamate kinase